MIDYKALLKLAISSALKAGRKTLTYYNESIEVMLKADESPLTHADLESNRIIVESLINTKIPILTEESNLVNFSERKDWKRFWMVDPLDGTKEFINKSAEYTINIALIENCSPILGVVYAPVLEKLYFGLENYGSYSIETIADMSIDEILSGASKLIVSTVPQQLRVVASKSHLNAETERFIEELKKHVPIGAINSYGSSLKICMVAEGKSDIYPRLGPTMEWDIAAGHAVARFAEYSVINIENNKPLRYNKENLLNPDFVVCHPSLEEAVKMITEQY